jgi:hypothetical protein
VLTNVTISGNSASTNGGGMYNSGSSDSFSLPEIRNSIIWGNGADPGISNGSGSVPVISHSIVHNSGGSLSWNISAGTDGGGNLDTDPLFAGWIDPAGSGWEATGGGDYRLTTGSPAIDAGDNNSYPNTWAKWQSLIGTSGAIDTQAKYDACIAPYINEDLAGNTRILGTAIDIGAYEH